MSVRSSLLAMTLALCVLGGSGRAQEGQDLAAVAPLYLAQASEGSCEARLWVYENWRVAHGLAPDAALDAAGRREKLGLARRSDAAIFAVKHGLVDDDS